MAERDPFGRLPDENSLAGLGWLSDGTESRATPQPVVSEGASEDALGESWRGTARKREPRLRVAETEADRPPEPEPAVDQVGADRCPAAHEGRSPALGAGALRWPPTHAQRRRRGIRRAADDPVRAGGSRRAVETRAVPQGVRNAR